MSGYVNDFGDEELGKSVLIDFPLRLAKEQNRTCLGLFIGQAGMGKTWAAVHLAEQLDPTFNIDRVCVTYKEFLTQLDEMAKLWTAGEDIAGRVVIFDEFQKGASARKFMSMINQAVNDVLFTFRYLNLIVFFTTPHIGFVDVNARAMMNFHVAMKEKRMDLGLTRGEVTFSEIKNNPHDPSDRLYYYVPRVETSEGTIRVQQIWFNAPSKRLGQQVDAKVTTFKHTVITDSISAIEKTQRVSEEKTISKGKVLRDLANEVYVNKGRYYDERRGKWDKGRVMLDYEFTPGKWNAIKPILEAMVQFGVKADDIKLPEE